MIYVLYVYQLPLLGLITCFAAYGDSPHLRSGHLPTIAAIFVVKTIKTHKKQPCSILKMASTMPSTSLAGKEVGKRILVLGNQYIVSQGSHPSRQSFPSFSKPLSNNCSLDANTVLLPSCITSFQSQSWLLSLMSDMI